VQLQWEEQVQRKSVQLALKQQRQQMAAAAADDDDDVGDKQQQRQDASESGDEVAGQGGSSSTGTPRIGQWGSAKAFTDTAAAGRQQQLGSKPLLSRQPGSTSSCRGVLQQCGNVQDSAAGLEAAAAAAGTSNTSAVGVKAPAGPAAVPQLRKRLAKPVGGAFKAPRMTAPAGNGSLDVSSKCGASDGDVAQQQDAAAGDDAGKRGSSGLQQQQGQQEEEEEVAVMAALGVVPAMPVDSSEQQQQLQVELASNVSKGPAAVSKVPCIASRVGLVGLRKSASGRAFVPPLKRS
jgi:hypothetical protein